MSQLLPRLLLLLQLLLLPLLLLLLLLILILILQPLLLRRLQADRIGPAPVSSTRQTSPTCTVGQLCCDCLFSGWTVFTLQTCHVEEDEFLMTDTNGTEIFMSKGDMPQRIGDEHEPGELLHKWSQVRRSGE